MEDLSISRIGNNDRVAADRIRKYFRPSSLQQSIKERSSLKSYGNPGSSNSSGTQWFQTLPKNPAFCTIGEKISYPIERPIIDVPKVTFNRTVFQSDEAARSCSNERTDPISGKQKILSKMKDKLNGKTCLKSRNVGSKKEHEKYCQKMYEKSGHRCTNQMIAKNKISRNDGNLRAIPGVQNIIRGLKRSRNYIKTGSSNEDVSKKRKVMEGNIVRNKRLLKAVENVISTMDNNDQNRSFASDSMEGISVETENQVQEPAKVLSNATTEATEILKPIFRKPEIEEYLDESMERAIKKYKTSLSFSMKLKKENSSSRSIPMKKNPVFCLPVQT